MSNPNFPFKESESVFAPPAIPRIAYSPAEAAEALGLTRQSIYRIMNRGELRSVKLGRSRRIPASALFELIGSGGADE